MGQTRYNSLLKLAASEMPPTRNKRKHLMPERWLSLEEIAADLGVIRDPRLPLTADSLNSVAILKQEGLALPKG